MPQDSLDHEDGSRGRGALRSRPTEVGNLTLQFAGSERRHLVERRLSFNDIGSEAWEGTGLKCGWNAILTCRNMQRKVICDPEAAKSVRYVRRAAQPFPVVDDDDCIGRRHGGLQWQR